MDILIKRRIFAQLMRSPNQSPDCLYQTLCFVIREMRVTFLSHLFALDLPHESSLYQLGQSLLHEEDIDLLDSITYYPNPDVHLALRTVLLLCLE